MLLYEIIQSLRKKAGMTQKEVAKELDCTPMHVSRMERSIENNGVIPSEKMIRKIAKLFAKTEDEREELERSMLLSKVLQGSSPEISTFIKKMVAGGVVNKGGVTGIQEKMPPGFISRLEKDLKQVKLDKFYKSISTQKSEVEAALSGNYILQRASIVEIAQALKSEPGEYLLLSGHIPREMSKIMEDARLQALFKKFSSLPNKDFDQILDVIMGVINISIKK